MHTMIQRYSDAAVVQKFKNMGFFHATGLPWADRQNEEYGFLEANRKNIGTWYHGEDGWIAAILLNGEIWLSKNNEMSKECEAFLSRMCPTGRILLFSIHCFDFEQIAERFANPWSDCNGFANPDPDPMYM